MPVMQMGELAQTGTTATVRHAGQAEIDAIGENHGQQRIAIVGRTACAPVIVAGEEPHAVTLRGQMN